MPVAIRTATEAGEIPHCYQRAVVTVVNQNWQIKLKKERGILKRRRKMFQIFIICKNNV